MTEFDFDELDRSISMAMAKGNAKKTAGARSLPGSEPTQPAATAENNTAPKFNPVASPSGAEASASSDKQRRGQFMDMVHPSSNMKRRPRIAPRTILPVTPPENAPRESFSAVPSSENSEFDNNDVENTTTSEFQFDKEPASGTNGEVGLFAEPEQTDTSASRGYHPKQMKIEPLAPLVSSESAPLTGVVDDLSQDDGQASVASDLHEPLYQEPDLPDSPFLSDTKPEKRPLGALQPTSDFAAQQTSDSLATSQPNLEVQPDETMATNDIPAMTRDVLADDSAASAVINPIAHSELESEPAANNSTSDMARALALDRETPPADEPDEPAANVSSPVFETVAETEPELEPDAPAAETPEYAPDSTSETTPEAAQPESVAEPELDMSATIEQMTALESEKQPLNNAGSIPQQYVEREVKKEPNAAIYDTEQYHIDVDDTPAPKPASKTKKKTAARLVWLAIFLLLGALAGAAGYYFMMNR